MMAGRVNSQARERMMSCRRKGEESVKALMSYVETSTKLQIAAQAEMSIPHRRRQARALKSEMEHHVEAMEAERARLAAARELEARQSSGLASEVERRTAERERQEREIQRICGESEELKELEAKLKIAYMNKERAAQHEERLEADRRVRLRDQAIEDRMEADRQVAMRDEFEKEASKQIVLQQQKVALQEQMSERERLKVGAAEAAERDRQLVADIVAKIRAEDEAEYTAKMRRKAEYHDLIKTYELQRARELEEARSKELREEDQIRQHAEAMRAREAEISRQRADKKARDAENFRRIVAETEKQRHEEEELQNLRDMLWQEEMEAARAKEERDRAEKRTAMTRSMARANEVQLAAKEERRKAEAEEERKRIEATLQKFAEDEEREQEQIRKRHRDKQHYIDLANKQRDDRLRIYEAARQVELDDAQRAAQADEYRKRVVAEARRRLLLEHASQLQGYLPKGVFQSEDDMPPR